MPKHKVRINKRYLKTKKLLLNRTLSPVSSPRPFTKPWGRGWRYPLPLGSLVTCYKIQQKWYFSAKKSFFFNLRSSEQKIQEHGKGALLFSSFLFFHFFQFLVSSSFIFWSLILQKQEPWQKGVRVLEGSHYCWPGILWFCFLFRNVRLPFSIMVSPVKSVLLKNI